MSLLLTFCNKPENHENVIHAGKRQFSNVLNSSFCLHRVGQSRGEKLESIIGTAREGISLSKKVINQFVKHSFSFMIAINKRRDKLNTVSRRL